MIGLLVILAYNRLDIKKIASENVEVEESLYDTNVNLIKCNTKADSIVIKASERSDIYVKSKKINNYKYSITKDDEILNIDCQYGRWYENVLNIGWMNELGFANEALFIEVPNYPERRNLYVFFGMSSPTDSLADDTAGSLRAFSFARSLWRKCCGYLGCMAFLP